MDTQENNSQIWLKDEITPMCTHTEASRQAHSPSYSKITVYAFPQAGSEWLLFNYSSGTTGEKAVPTIHFFFIWNYMWEMPLGSMLKMNVSLLK